MGFPTDMFPVLFTIPRVAGWLAHWVEQLDDAETKIWRPRQVYTGHGVRNYVPMSDRSTGGSSADGGASAQILTSTDRVRLKVVFELYRSYLFEPFFLLRTPSPKDLQWRQAANCNKVFYLTSYFPSPKNSCKSPPAQPRQQQHI